MHFDSMYIWMFMFMQIASFSLGLGILNLHWLNYELSRRLWIECVFLKVEILTLVWCNLNVGWLLSGIRQSDHRGFMVNCLIDKRNRRGTLFCCHIYVQWEVTHLQIRSIDLISHCIYWHLRLGLPSLEICEYVCI